MRKRNVSPAPPRPTSNRNPPTASSCICCGIDFSLWLPIDPSKRWAEIFNILYCPVWIVAFAIFIGGGFYQHMHGGELGYFLVGLFMALPCVVYPLLCPGDADKGRPLLERYWVKCNLWIFIFGWVGNYFWTHYFYTVLGAKYTFSLKWRINDVPITCYLATHAYFIFYHSLTNLILRRLRRALAALPSAASVAITCLVILVLAYVTAFMETFTIANFPYYEFKDRDYAYTIGSAFYAIYFIVSFPMFLRIDEHPGSSSKWPISRVAIDALAAAMLVTILLDAWRLVAKRTPGLVWVQYNSTGV